MIKPKTIIITLVVLAIILIAFITLYHPKKEEAYSLKIGYLPITVDLPFFVAMENGYFTEEGLQVNAIRFEATTQLYDAMLSERVDATAIGGLAALYGIEAQAKGQFKIYTFNANDETYYTDTLLVKKDSNITSPSQLKGKKIGTFPGTTIVVGTKLIMRKFNLSDTDYEIVQLPPHLQLQALETGQVDALMTLEPTGTIARLKGIGKVILEAPNAKYLINPFPGGAAAFKTSWIEQHPELALKIKRATDKAIDFIRENPAEAKKTLPKYTGLEEDIASETLLCLYWKVEDTDRKAVQEYADILHQEGIFKDKVNTFNFYFEPGKSK